METANNSKLNILGSTIIKMQIAAFIIHYQAVVVNNLCSPILLGICFMVKTQTVMNLKDNIILFKYENQEIELTIKIQKVKNKLPKTEIQYVSQEILNEY